MIFRLQRCTVQCRNGCFPFIKSLHGDKDSAYSKYMDDAIFKVPTPLMLDKIVTSMDGIYEQIAQLKNADTRGDIYEYLLSKLATAGVNGQFRTPRHIIRMMVELMEPKADEIICDPACGTSGFLVSASEYLREMRKEEVFLIRKIKSLYESYVSWIRYGQNDASHRRNEHDDPWGRQSVY